MIWGFVQLGWWAHMALLWFIGMTSGTSRSRDLGSVVMPWLQTFPGDVNHKTCIQESLQRLNLEKSLQGEIDSLSPDKWEVFTSLLPRIHRDPPSVLSPSICISFFTYWHIWAGWMNWEEMAKKWNFNTTLGSGKVYVLWWASCTMGAWSGVISWAKHLGGGE